MTVADRHREMQALLTRAADCEAARQSALRRNDLPARDALEHELPQLWQRYLDIDTRAA